MTGLVSAVRSAGWRPMQAADRAVCWNLARAVHADYPERDTILTERLALFPNGCLVLERGASLQGYVVGHPWRLDRPPKLDTLLGALPDHPDTFTIHDLALAASARRTGAGRAVIEHLAHLAASAALSTLSLVSVGKSRPFWEACGFAIRETAAVNQALASYDSDACYMVRILPPER